MDAVVAWGHMGEHAPLIEASALLNVPEGWVVVCLRLKKNTTDTTTTTTTFSDLREIRTRHVFDEDGRAERAIYGGAHHGK